VVEMSAPGGNAADPPTIDVEATAAASQFVLTNGVRLRVLQRGDRGPQLLVLPGITSPAATWDFVARRLAIYCRVTVVDMRGRGLSDQPPSGYLLEDYVADTAELVQALGLSGCVVLGHSMGARVGLVFAARHPELLSKLIAVDPPTTAPGRRPYKTPLDRYLADKRAITAEGAAAIRRLNPAWTDEQVAMRARWLPTCSDAAIAESYRSMHEESFYPSLPLIRCPMLLLYAAEGNTVSDDDAREIIAQLPRGRAVRVERSGHIIPWDNLPDFLAAVQEFIRSE
jgi:N-formylmaleamate deformylase